MSSVRAAATRIDPRHPPAVPRIAEPYLGVSTVATMSAMDHRPNGESAAPGDPKFMIGKR
ncbi:hypothetical protein [Mycolicibacter algericus]|uniref:Uncharacterized protein n=3 Tax=Mycolicibacter TaxID=1073531 RepID=A0A7I9YFI5_MYCAL|nr:hypothetical protein [Mycolicibacter algericus]OQZ98422.1 hypothetical protein BST10_06435 [Mycolicibacter algericus DSM 45454]GFG71671.1 hypothetical protein MSEN_33910 [Mycolicibacter senuensis]GFG87438.1 hypothetical protein MALGJ_41140 [Mycolicibacter algericus]